MCQISQFHPLTGQILPVSAWVYIVFPWFRIATREVINILEAACVHIKIDIQDGK